MRKLKLDPEDLRVESFDAGEGASKIGTVRGNMPFVMPATDDTEGGGSGGDPSGYNTCSTCPTYQKTCRATCGLDFCTDLTCLTRDYCCP